MQVADNPPKSVKQRPKLSAIGEQFLSAKVLFTVYVIAAILGTASKLILPDLVVRGFQTPRLIPYGVFRYAFFHLIHHQDIYAAFPLEPDIFKYSPTFALFMAPFAALPYSLGAILWGVLNGVAIFAGIWAIPRVSDRSKAFILWFILLRVFGNFQNAQSDALMAGLMVGAWAAQERQKPLLSSFCLVLSVFVKIFGGLALLPCLMVGHWRKQWPKLFAYLAMWSVLFAGAPLAVVSPGQLLFLYRSWYGRLQVDAANAVGIDVAEILRQWFHLHVSDLYVDAVGAAVLLLVFLLRTDAYKEFRFRILAISSVSIWVVIFNHMAQSTSMVIAVTGIAIWYFLEEPNLANGILTAFAFVLTILFSTSIVPGALSRLVLRPNLLSYAVPCVLAWIKLQYDLLRFPRGFPSS
jgi:hypothetical protein